VANSEHVAIINKGTEAWNRWRAENSTEKSRPDLSGAEIIGANLDRTDLSASDLRKANLSEADLRGADFGSADLRQARLINADLRGADFSGADLREANLTVRISARPTSPGRTLYSQF
jgi:hypothetical protein